MQIYLRRFPEFIFARTSEGIKFSTLEQLSIVFFTLIDVIFLTSSADHQFFDGETLSIIILFALGRILLLYMFADRSPPLMLIVLITILFFDTRMTVLVIWPTEAFAASNWTYDSVNFALGYMSLVLIAAMIGASLAPIGSWNSTPRLLAPWTEEGKSAADIAFVLLCITITVQLVLYFSFGEVSHKLDHSEDQIIKRVGNQIFQLTSVIALYFGVLRYYPQRRKYYLILFIIIFLVYSIITGSRSGLLTAAIFAIILEMSIRGNFSIKINITTVSVVILALLALLPIWYLATIIRALFWQSGGVAFIGSDYLSDTFGDMIDTMISNVSLRLNMIDYYFFQMGASYDGSDLVNIGTQILSTINMSFPFHPFDNVIPAELAFGYLLSSKGVWVGTEYTAYEWELHGICWQLFGWFGPVFAFIATYGLSCLFSKLSFSRTILGSTVCFMAGYAIILWIQNFGFDNFISRQIRPLIFLIPYLAVFRGLVEAMKRTTTQEGAHFLGVSQQLTR